MDYNITLQANCESDTLSCAKIDAGWLSSGVAISTARLADYAIGCSTAVESLPDREKMPDKAKTLMHLDAYGKNLFLKIADDKGYVDEDRLLMSDIVDVEVISKEFKSRIIVTFANGTSESATLDRFDEFNLEQGISICIAKHLVSEKVGCKYGSSAYNKIIDRAAKVLKKRDKEKAQKAAEEEAKKRKYEKMIAKKKAKRQKREAEEREEQIEIQKEAILRALNQWNTRTAD